MKAIYNSPPLLCTIRKDTGDGVFLSPLEGGEHREMFFVSYADPSLIIDPTDDEVFMVENMSNKVYGSQGSEPLSTSSTSSTS